MATPPDSPGPEEAFFEFESTRARHQTTRPVPIEELLRQTKFSRQEIRVMYRGFKQVCNVFLDLLGALSILSLREGHKREIMQKGHRNVFAPLRFFYNFEEDWKKDQVYASI